MQQTFFFKVFRIMSKFEGKAGLPHPSKFLTNLKFLELTFCHKFFVFFINFASIVIFFFMETKQITIFFVLILIILKKKTKSILKLFEKNIEAFLF